MLRYVVSAFCGDTDDQFYHFNKKDKSEGIFLNPDVYTALVKYKSVFEKQNYYEWIKYLEKASPVDHFIPWSFVKDDKLWNFVLACPHCNSAKSNVVPDQGYFTALKERNSKLCNMDLPIVRQDFKTYSYSRLIEMQHSAVFNGFEYGWKA